MNAEKTVTPQIATIKLIGTTYGWLTIVGIDLTGTRTRFVVNCACGNTGMVRGASVKNSKSCGCHLKEKNLPIKHGMAGTPIYNSWCTMIARTTKPNNISYPWYGGRGIKVCERWMKFENFFADMGPRPTPKHSIDRINSDGNYEPGNCRWATKIEQARNRKLILNCNTAQEIRRLHSEGWNGAKIGRCFGISKELVYTVTSGKSWRHDPTYSTPNNLCC